MALAACQRETTTEKIYVRDPKNGGQLGGVDSTGGGNGLNGKPLESYYVNIEQQRDYKEFIEPIVLQVVKKFPRLASDIISIATDRKWFLVPVALEKIPSVQIGVAFPVDQMALQSRSAVWIDDTIFAKMPTGEDRARLMLHELVMGVRLMQFQNGLNHCLSAIAIHRVPDYSKEKYADLRRKCMKEFGGLDGTPGFGRGITAPDIGAPFKLSDEDYENIRDLTIQLWTSKGDIDSLEIANWMKAKKFRSYQ